MPTLARFYGILIRMRYNDHAPPHIHAVYGEAVAMKTAKAAETTSSGAGRRLRGCCQGMSGHYASVTAA